MAEFHRPTSRFVSTPVKDFYLDIWKPIAIPKSANDESFVITPRYHERPDLLAFDKYGTTRLWWIFAMRNPDILVDPIRDFTSGTEITLPSLKTIESVA